MKRIGFGHDSSYKSLEIEVYTFWGLVPGAKIGEKCIKTPVKPLKTIQTQVNSCEWPSRFRPDSAWGLGAF